MQKSIDRLVKLFDRYRDIEDYTSRLEEQKKKLSAYREARKYLFVSDLVGGKEKYDENLAVGFGYFNFRAGVDTLGVRYREKQAKIRPER